MDEEVAFGSSVSLYERNPLTGVPAGNPIADVYAVCARENNAVSEWIRAERDEGEGRGR